MAFSQTDLDAINEAISSGALEVKYADRTVKYQTTEALLLARSVIMNEVDPTRRENNGRSYASFSKGLDSSCGRG